jgi:hypothetical protein
LSAAPGGGTILINASVQPSLSAGAMIITNAVQIRTVYGPSTLGN